MVQAFSEKGQGGGSADGDDLADPEKKENSLTAQDLNLAIF